MVNFAVGAVEIGFDGGTRQRAKERARSAGARGCPMTKTFSFSSDY